MLTDMVHSKSLVISCDVLLLVDSLGEERLKELSFWSKSLQGHSID